jgi:processive 1,2-diacylglycerol beta-glucosyltransferase
MKKPRVLILTAGFGEGHNAAARALAAACDALHGPGTARLVDVFALASPRLNALTRRVYLGLINRTPRLWSSVYAWVDRAAIFPRALLFFRRESRLLGRIIAAEQPAVLCSTYFIYAYLLEGLAREGRPLPPHFNIVTDSISINSLWWRAACTGWFLPNPESAEVLGRAGIATERLHVAGFPSTRFSAPTPPHSRRPPSPAAPRRVCFTSSTPAPASHSKPPPSCSPNPAGPSPARSAATSPSARAWKNSPPPGPIRPRSSAGPTRSPACF